MRNQIILANILFLTIVILLPISAFYAQSKIFTYISSHSTELLQVQQDKSQLIIIGNMLMRRVALQHIKIINQLESISKSYNYFDYNNITIDLKYPLPACVPSAYLKGDDYFINYESFCYQANGLNDSITLPKNDTSVQSLHSTLTLLSGYSMIFGLDIVKLKEYFHIGAVSNIQYLATYPVSYLIKTYNVLKRPWYQNHVQAYSKNPDLNISYTPPFNHFLSQTLEVSICYSIKSKAKELIAVSKTQLRFDSYMIPQIPYNVFLLDNTGVVLYTNSDNYFNDSQSIYLYNQSITGFNKTDWLIIQENSLNNNQTPQIFYHKLSNQSVYLIAFQLPNQEYTLIIYSNITTTIEMQGRLDEKNQELNTIFMKMIVSNFSFSVFLMLLEFIVIVQIFAPIHRLTMEIRQHTLRVGNNINREIFKLINNKPVGNQFLILQQKMLNIENLLNGNQNNKSKICKIYEQIQYNKKERPFKVKQLRKATLDLKDDQHQLKQKIKNIIKLLFNHEETINN
ncbi:unnamed protein product (macronuclear) [Paramecium tetraurelia]|uniref:Transmembrane protein n=1 Tax=Paramecium tetraurelia TaxID=5888 RepID=A0ECC4_PARTE|nr:uncharacterized protein GSPATT00025678001 [Paramecium tetraurelia]CAK92941.1 unnamed protein product [Paramecium tetraurelia]|eukprot:XP_001460338.1 hypothetical protein (macronuclear) [Paramecium tetraurelia strain d4-2]